MVNLKHVLPFIGFAFGERLWHNPGNTAACDFVREEHNGRVEEVTNVFHSSPQSLKMTQTYDPSYSGRYHSECDRNDGYTRGDSRFYGFAFRLSDQWEFEGGQGYNLAQFIANREGAGCGGDDWMPSAMLWIKGNVLTSRIVSGSYRQPDCSRSIEQLDDLATVQAGVWHRVVMQVNWQSQNTGLYKIWFDGQKVFERFNVATTVNDDEHFQFRIGLYANSWYDDDGGMVGNQPFRQIWYDEIAIGTEFADVDPKAS